MRQGNYPGVAYPRLTSDVLAQVNTALGSQNRDTMLALAAQSTPTTIEAARSTERGGRVKL